MCPRVLVSVWMSKVLEKLKYDGMDSYFALLQAFEDSTEVRQLPFAAAHVLILVSCQGPKVLYKADIDSAYRRVPILPEHRKFASVMFLHEGAVYTSTHTAMMFGGVASVHAWHRVACLLRAIARRCLKLPMLCFVDDFFSVDTAVAAQHSKECFARLVKACLGEDAIAQHKLVHGNPLEVLGIDVTVSDSGAIFWPAPTKVAKWIG